MKFLIPSLEIAAGVTSVVAAICLLATWYFHAAVRRKERSISQLVGSDLLDEIDTILKQFKDDKLKLEALTQLLTSHGRNADSILKKVKSGIDIAKLSGAQDRHRSRIFLIVSIVLVILAIILSVSASISPPKPLSGLESLDQLIARYERFASYSDNSITIITGRFGNQQSTVELKVTLASDFAFQKPDLLRLNSHVALTFAGIEIAEGKYQLYAHDRTTFIYDQSRRQFLSYSNASLDLLHQRPENDPIKHVAMAALKTYQFVLNGDKAKLLNQMSHVNNPKVEADQFGGATTILGWNEDIRSADKWMAVGVDKTTFHIPIEIHLTKSGIVSEAASDLTEVFSFIFSNKDLIAGVGPWSMLLSKPISVESKTIHKEQSIDKKITPDYFRFTPENDATEVAKLEFPTNKLSVLKNLWR